MEPEQLRDAWEKDFAKWDYAPLPEGILDAVLRMTDEQRLTLSTVFCNECGELNEPGEKPCQCWNDE